MSDGNGVPTMQAHQPQSLSPPREVVKLKLRSCQHEQKRRDTLEKDSFRSTLLFKELLKATNFTALPSKPLPNRFVTRSDDPLPTDGFGELSRKRCRMDGPVPTSVSYALRPSNDHGNKNRHCLLGGNLPPTFAPQCLLKGIELVDRSGRYSNIRARASSSDQNLARITPVSVDFLTSKMAILSLKQTHFRLLDLPGEIPNHIYRLIICCPIIRVPTEVQKVEEPGMFDLRKHRLLQPSITRVSRQLRSETLSVFYAENTFMFDMVIGIHIPFIQWIHAIGPVNASYLTTVRLRLSVNSRSDDSVLPRFGDTILKLSKDRSFLYLGMTVPIPPRSQNDLAGPVQEWLCSKKNLTGCDLLTFVAALLHCGNKMLCDFENFEPKKQVLYPIKFFPDLQSTSKPGTASPKRNFVHSLRLMEAAMVSDFNQCEPYIKW